MSLRIAFVTIGYAPHRTSGLDISGERLVRALLDEGHQVCVVAGTEAPLREIQQHPGLEIHRIHLGRSNWIGFAYRAAQLIRALNHAQPFDTVHFWDVYFAYAYDGPYVASLQHSFRQRWSAWDRQQSGGLSTFYRWTYYSLARIAAERPAVSRATGLLAASRTARDEYMQHYGLAPERIAVARHGIDIQFFRPRPASGKLRDRYGIGASDPIILFVGFVTPRKGLEYLARALPLVRPRARLLVAGRWSKHNRARFLQMLGPAADRLIEAGFVPDEQMPDLYNLANLYVSPSLLEGFGLPLAEALACGTPVVAADAGSVTEVVGPGGILVPPRDAGALADAISQVLADPGLARNLGALGREHIVAEFSLEQMRNDTLEAYRRFSVGQSRQTISERLQTPRPDLGGKRDESEG